MKKIAKMVLVLGITALGFTPLAQSKDSLHLNYKQDMTDNGVEPGAKGSVKVSDSVEGNSSKQKLDITLSGLTGGTDYSMVATINDGSNTTVGLLDFTTDSHGKASLHLSSSSKGHGGGKNNPLPNDFDLTQVLALDVVNGDALSVLTANTTNPSSLKYQVKRDLSANGVKSKLQIKSNNGHDKFSLTASGLDANTDYQLVFNGAPVDTVTTDSKGKLKINLDSDPLPGNILDLQTAELWDMSNSVIVGTTTPLP